MAAQDELELRETAESDLEFVLAAEADPGSSKFLMPWPRERHLASIAAPDEEHLLILAAGQPVGFALLAGLANEHRSLEVRRLLVTRRGEGIGRRALGLIVERAFERYDANRVWLDAVTWNERAHRCYAAAGFVREGVLREALLKEGRFESLVLMSLLRSEWEAGAR